MSIETMNKYLWISRILVVLFGIANLILVFVMLNVSTADWSDSTANLFRAVSGIFWGCFAISIVAASAFTYQIKKRKSSEKIVKLQQELEELKRRSR